MKKILCAILLVACLISAVACNGKGNDKTGDDGEMVTGFAAFEKAIAAASASKVIVTVKTVNDLGELNSSYEIYFNEDNSATVNYSYERFYEIGEGPEGETVEKKTGTLYRDKDGKYSEDLGVDLSAVSASAAFNISPLKTIATVSESSDVLTATVPKISAKSVFGMDFNSNVDFKMVLRDGKLSTLTLISSNKEIKYTYAVD